MERNICLDVLKLSMAFMIVGLHAGFLGDISSLAKYLTSNGLFRIAVPMFLLINGFYFFTVVSAQKCGIWFKRIFFLYMVWMSIYSYFWFTPSDLSITGFLKFAQIIIFGYEHLWYISGMIGAAVMVVLLKEADTRLLITSIILTFVGGVAIQYMGNYHLYEGTILDKYFNDYRFHRNFFFFSYPFFCLGFLVNKLGLLERISTRMSVALSFLGMSLLLCESYFNYINPSRDGGFDNFCSLILVCPAFFFLCMNINIKGEGRNIALYSSAIFFTHYFILNLVNRFADFGGTALTIIVVLISIIVSFFVIRVNGKLKFLL